MFDYRLLEALGCVIQEQGFDKAAQRLFITQSAVSQRIKTLEDQTGQVLVSRTVPPVATPAGKRLLKHYLQVKMLEADLEETTSDKSTAGITQMAVGINADSLATWFMPAVRPFLNENRVVLDLLVDDQDQTHKMLRNGEVIGCVSSEESPVQGCRVSFLGTMTYILAATPLFVQTYDIEGLDEEKLVKAPAVIFNRKDDLHHLFFKRFYHKAMPRLPVHYVPSSESFADMIFQGVAYGMIPDLQGRDHFRSGALIDLAPECHIQVDLYWHCWHINSVSLSEFSTSIVKNAVIW